MTTKFEITHELKDQNRVQEIKIGNGTSPNGIFIAVKGYSTFVGSDDAIIHLEYYNGKMLLHVWGNVNSEDPTATIDLEKAKEKYYDTGSIFHHNKARSG